MSAALRVGELFAGYGGLGMGLPGGWVTGVPGVTRTRALRLLGNGVVPQQAAHALRLLSTVSRAGAVAA